MCLSALPQREGLDQPVDASVRSAPSSGDCRVDSFTYNLAAERRFALPFSLPVEGLARLGASHTSISAPLSETYANPPASAYSRAGCPRPRAGPLLSGSCFDGTRFTRPGPTRERVAGASERVPPQAVAAELAANP